MPNWSGTVLTAKGLALQAKVEAGATMEITKLKIGDGVLGSGQTVSALNDLVAPKKLIDILALTPLAGGTCKIHGVVTNTEITTGFYVRELGVFAQDPDIGEILYAYTTDGAPDFLPPTGGAVAVSEELVVNLAFSNAATITANVTLDGLVTVSLMQQTIQQKIEDHDHSGGAEGTKIKAQDIDNTLFGGLGTDNVQATMEALLTKFLEAGSTTARNVVLTGPVTAKGIARLFRDRYGENLCFGGTAISGGDYLVSNAKTYVFDGNNSTQWQSSQATANQSGAAYVGYNFSADRHIRKIVLVHSGVAANTISSIKVQNSVDGITWVDVATVSVYVGTNVIELGVSNSRQYWRVLANANLATAYTWVVLEVEMYELVSPTLANNDIIILADAIYNFAAGLTEEGPIDYRKKQAGDSVLSLGAADQYTIPIAYTEDICNNGAAISGGDAGSFPASYAFNNAEDSYWASSQLGAAVTNTAWIGYNYGTVKAVRKVRVRHPSASYFAATCKLQYSDNGTVWSDACSMTFPTNVNWTEHTVNSGAHQYWRLLATSATVAGYNWVVHEIEMYEALQTYYVYADYNPLGRLITFGASRNKPKTKTSTLASAGAVVSGYYTADQCTGGTAISGGDNAGKPAANAFNDDGSTSFWTSSQTAVNGIAYIGYGFGAAKTVRRIILAQDGGATNAVTSVKVRYSDDGSTWSVASTNTVIPGSNVIDISSVGAHQYWSLLANSATGGATNWAVNEIEMMELIETTVTVAADNPIYGDNVAVGGTAISGGDYTATASYKEKAFDGDATTSWSSNVVGATVVNTGYIGYDFGVARHIRKVVLSQYDAPHAVNQVKIRRSTDGVAWSDVATVDVALENTITLPVSVASRFWQIIPTSATGINAAYYWSVTNITMHEISTDLNYYDPYVGEMKHYDGSTWETVIREFIGEVVVDAQGRIVSHATYPYNISRLKSNPAESSDDVVTLGQLLTNMTKALSAVESAWFQIPTITSDGKVIKILVQMGGVTTNVGDVSTPVTFPLSYPQFCVAGFASPANYQGGVSGVDRVTAVSAFGWTKTGMSVASQSQNARSLVWLTIGF